MRMPQILRSREISFDMTPLIDVVFLLIIFFLVASHFAHREPTEEVQLPAADATVEENSPRRLTITILATGQYYIGAEQVTLAEIATRIAEGAGDDAADFAVRIRGDRRAPYRWIEPLLLECARNNVTAFGFQTTRDAPQRDR